MVSLFPRWISWATLCGECLGHSCMAQMGKSRLREAKEEQSTWHVGLPTSARSRSLNSRPVFFLLHQRSPMGSLWTSLLPSSQMCFLWLRSVWIWMACQHLKIRRVHIKTQISGFSWTIGSSAKWGLHSCLVTIEDHRKGHSLEPVFVYSLPQSPPLPECLPGHGAWRPFAFRTLAFLVLQDWTLEESRFLLELLSLLEREIRIREVTQ